MLLLLKGALALKAMMLSAMFAKGVLLGGAGATATAAAVVAAGCAMRRCGRQRDQAAPAAPAAATGAS